MNKALMDVLVAKFLEWYDAPAMDAIWQQHSATFRRFWSGRVLAKGNGTISDDECDVVIRILDHTGKGNTKESEVVAKTMVPQGAWHHGLGNNFALFGVAFPSMIQDPNNHITFVVRNGAVSLGQHPTGPKAPECGAVLLPNCIHCRSIIPLQKLCY